MEISFRSRKLEKIFRSDADLRKKFIPHLVPTLRKRLGQIQAAPTYGLLRLVNAGNPHLVHELGDFVCSITISGNIRLFIEVEADSVEALPDAVSCVVRGVGDYHGQSSISWYIS